MANARRIDKTRTIPCELTEEARSRINSYADALIRAAPSIGNHGLDSREFWRSRIFFSAVEEDPRNKCRVDGGQKGVCGKCSRAP